MTELLSDQPRLPLAGCVSVSEETFIVYCCYVVQVCLPALRRAKCEWPVWAVNHPGPRLLTVSDDDDDWMMMMMRLRMMKIDVFDSDAAESVAIHLLFAFLIILVLF